MIDTFSEFFNKYIFFMLFFSRELDRAKEILVRVVFRQTHDVDLPNIYLD